MTEISEISKITGIIRGLEDEEIAIFLEAALQTKINSVEIAISEGEKSLRQIEKFRRQYDGKITIGAGTVTNLEILKDVVAAGAQFVLSPTVMTIEMLNYCSKRKIISVPGAFSPSEILKSVEDGADIVKVFPVENLGEKFVANIKAPLPDLKLMAVGGVGKDNYKELLDGGYDYLGIGSSLVNRPLLKKGKLEDVVSFLKEFEY